jgi:hypothetical protein
MKMLKRLRKEERGNVLVIVALALSVLMAAAAMAVDAGQLYFEKSKLQKTVDAAALAGAHALLFREFGRRSKRSRSAEWLYSRGKRNNGGRKVA